MTWSSIMAQSRQSWRRAITGTPTVVAGKCVRSGRPAGRPFAVTTAPHQGRPAGRPSDRGPCTGFGDAHRIRPGTSTPPPALRTHRCTEPAWPPVRSRSAHGIRRWAPNSTWGLETAARPAAPIGAPSRHGLAAGGLRAAPDGTGSSLGRRPAARLRARLPRDYDGCTRGRARCSPASAAGGSSSCAARRPRQVPVAPG